MNIIEYRKVSQAFRRIASNMLTTKYDDGNIHLIRLRKFIQENELINNIIQDKVRNVDYDYKGNFIVEDGGWSSILIPIDESEHIKAMYDYLVDITNEEEDIRGRAHNFYHSSGKWNDIIREYLDKAFKPLVDFIVDSLSMEMIGMESVKQETHIHQNINKNYGTASVAQGNIESVNNVTLNDLQDIKELVESLKDLIIKEEIDEMEKEEVVDDLETIEQEINSENPKHVKIRKAWQGIKSFMSKIPGGLAKATIIATQCGELYEKLKPFIEK
ncbi:hypothetical protein FCV36_11480 [Clostridium sporogenes]|uniref:hypothetical protein n=1 Tax=Clostridium sporogenes TaxID=1509 RepID=UPI0013D53A63|nr:hypothetical protein [Clostridium sporogenes]NFG02907.1 hypothetical protein [Clostridium sporogenes]